MFVTGGIRYTTVRLVALVIAVSLVAGPAVAQTCLSGGSDDDTDFDLRDFAAFQRCFTGSTGGIPGGECAGLDFDGDTAIDLSDLAVLVARANGPIGALPVVVVSQPASPTTSTTVTIAGTAEWSCTVEVSGGVSNVIAPVIHGEFSVDVELHSNAISHLFVTGIARNGTRGSPTPVTITQDAQAPNLFIDFPVDGAEVTTATTDVAGRVGDLLSGFMGLTVTVNGVPAIVDVGIGNNGTFFAADVPLTLDTSNILEATATDELGNSITKQILVTQVAIPPDAPQLQVLSGNAQTGQVGTVLLFPIVVRVTHGDGTPFANKVVTFDVTRSNGRLTEDGVGEGDMMLQVRTDINGEARAFWMLGSDAGCGNNRVEVASTSIVGTTAFCASATAAAAAQINIGSGNNQRAEADGPAPEPLSVWVSDSRNQAGGVSVTFTVVEGGGKVDGADFSDVLTDQTGHAEVNFTLGPDPGVNIVEATFGANPGLPATFTVTGVVRDVSRPTSFSGLVLDNANRPIQGADHLRDRPLGFSLDATRFFGSDGGSITRKNLAVPPSHGWCCAEALEDRRSDGDRTGVAGSGARTGGLALARTMERVV